MDLTCSSRIDLGAEPLPVERAEAEQERTNSAEERQRPDDRLREAADGHRGHVAAMARQIMRKQERPDRAVVTAKV